MAAAGTEVSQTRRFDPDQELAKAHARIAALEAAVTARESFIAAIGHELRNPLVPIVLTVERLRDLAASGDLERIRRSVEILANAKDAFVRRTTQLLDLSRITSGHFALDCAPIDLSCCIDETLERHTDIARRAGCTLHRHIAPGIGGLNDRASLEQLLDNLLSNAFKYGAGRPVEVHFTADRQHGRLVVRDHGAGIPADEQSRIFGLFERARNAGSPGLGIGLWISAQIAGAMDGVLSLESAHGAGAAFILTFPLAGPAAGNPAAPEALKAPRVQEEARDGS
jgi:signal transduction histidine kinase